MKFPNLLKGQFDKCLYGILIFFIVIKDKNEVLARDI